MTLIDSNVLLDLVTNDPVWADWSIAQLDRASLSGPLRINDVIYAELAVRYQTIEALNQFLDEAGIAFASLPKEALFLAAKVFASYRRNGGTRTGVLPDFFIGAHAAVNAMPLLTRDTGRYSTYFPTVHLITSEKPSQNQGSAS